MAVLRGAVNPPLAVVAIFVSVHAERNFIEKVFVCHLQYAERKLRTAVLLFCGHSKVAHSLDLTHLAANALTPHVPYHVLRVGVAITRCRSKHLPCFDKVRRVVVGLQKKLSNQELRLRCVTRAARAHRIQLLVSHGPRYRVVVVRFGKLIPGLFNAWDVAVQRLFANDFFPSIGPWRVSKDGQVRVVAAVQFRVHGAEESWLAG